jgi:hypothetical protein
MVLVISNPNPKIDKEIKKNINDTGMSIDDDTDDDEDNEEKVQPNNIGLKEVNYNPNSSISDKSIGEMCEKTRTKLLDSNHLWRERANPDPNLNPNPNTNTSSKSKFYPIHTNLTTALNKGLVNTSNPDPLLVTISIEEPPSLNSAETLKVDENNPIPNLTPYPIIFYDGRVNELYHNHPLPTSIGSKRVSTASGVTDSDLDVSFDNHGDHCDDYCDDDEIDNGSDDDGNDHNTDTDDVGCDDSSVSSSIDSVDEPENNPNPNPNANPNPNPNYNHNPDFNSILVYHGVLGLGLEEQFSKVSPCLHRTTLVTQGPEIVHDDDHNDNDKNDNDKNDNGNNDSDNGNGNGNNNDNDKENDNDNGNKNGNDTDNNKSNNDHDYNMDVNIDSIKNKITEKNENSIVDYNNTAIASNRASSSSSSSSSSTFASSSLPPSSSSSSSFTFSTFPPSSSYSSSSSPSFGKKAVQNILLRLSQNNEFTQAERLEIINASG